MGNKPKHYLKFKKKKFAKYWLGAKVEAIQSLQNPARGCSPHLKAEWLPSMLFYGLCSPTSVTPDTAKGLECMNHRDF